MVENVTQRNWNGKTCVITGASSGIGRALAVDLASRGAVVCVAARREDLLRDLLEELGGAALGHSYLVADVSKRADVDRLAAHVIERYDHCDVLVNNAGYSAPASPLDPASPDVIEGVMATNFWGAVWLTTALMPMLVRSAPSHVVNVASVAGRLAVKGSPAYTASKFALVGWSESISYELAPRGVYVSLIEPGLIPTEGFPHRGWQKTRLARLVLGSTEDVADAVRDAVENRKLQRVVPRWYYLLQVPRLVAPRWFSAGQARVTRPGSHSK